MNAATRPGSGFLIKFWSVPDQKGNFRIQDAEMLG